jgi:uncharacterized membrane protein
MAFMPYATYGFEDDHSLGYYEVDLREVYDAVRWMQENIAGSPVVVQSILPIYRGGMPYTMYTGLPNVVGWLHHQRQQRGVVADAWIDERYGELTEFYRTPDAAVARAFLRRYGVEYIIVGPLERAYFPEYGLRKFEEMRAAGELEEVFAEGQIVIYRVGELRE